MQDDETNELGPDRAVIDHIVDGETAVLLIGPEETELHLPASLLPAGAGEGTWVVLDLQRDPPAVVGIDAELTERRAREMTDRLDAIRRGRTGGRFRE